MDTVKIVKAVITKMPKSNFDPMPEVIVTFEDGEEKTLFSFYPGEIQFTEQEFIGLTEAEARTLRVNKDEIYLRS